MGRPSSQSFFFQAPKVGIHKANWINVSGEKNSWSLVSSTRNHNGPHSSILVFTFTLFLLPNEILGVFMSFRSKTMWMETGLSLCTVMWAIIASCSQLSWDTRSFRAAFFFLTGSASLCGVQERTRSLRCLYSMCLSTNMLSKGQRVGTQMGSSTLRKASVLLMQSYSSLKGRRPSFSFLGLNWP